MGQELAEPRFVVLEHRREDIHWDVMFEHGHALRTWAVDAPIVAGATLPTRPLPDHRRLYLDYEGPIAGDRGEVRRVASGTYRRVEWTEDRIVVALQSDQLSGRLTLSRTGGGAWFLRFQPGKLD